MNILVETIARGLPLWCIVWIWMASYVRNAVASETSTLVMILVLSSALIAIAGTTFQFVRFKIIFLVGLVALVIGGVSYKVFSHQEAVKRKAIALLQEQVGQTQKYSVIVERKLSETTKDQTYQAYFEDPHLSVAFTTKNIYFYHDEVLLRGKLTVTEIPPARVRLKLKEEESIERTSKIVGRIVYATQTYLSGIYQTYLQEETLGITEGIVLGMQNHLPYWFSSLFRDVGISHIIVLSGYNILLVYEGLFLLGRSFLNRTTIVATSLILSYILVLIAGNTEASARAYQSILLHEILRVFGIMPSIERTILYLIVYISIVTVTPLNDHIGLLLSCAATLGIVYTMKIYTMFTKSLKIHKYVSGLASAIVTTLGAWMGTLPIIIGYFGVATPGGMVMSLLVIPLVFMYTVVGIGFLLVGMLAQLVPLIQPLLLWTAWGLTKATSLLVSMGITIRYHIPSFIMTGTMVLILVACMSCMFAIFAIIKKSEAFELQEITKNR
ncbi:MAG TPA: ComEC/Rec2 family competence protein [Candidatus Paceibacterota bacterium]